MTRAVSIIVGALLLALAAAYIWWNQGGQRVFFTPTDTRLETGTTGEESSAAVEVVAQDLEIPWEIAFLPDGNLLVTERPGRLLRIGSDRRAILIEGVAHVGEGGLLGVTLHPNFASNRLIYLYLTTRDTGGLTNRVERYRFENDQLSDRTVIIENIPGAQFHDGGELAFGPDGLLYITTGDATDQSLSQDTNSLAGKILRLHDDGRVPADNPFGNAVYSYGHRNSQGIAWDEDGQLWATEHGPSNFDEINRIERGANYGWPTIRGDEQRADLRPPVIHSGAGETWAPGGIVSVNGRLFFSGLRGQSLYEAARVGENIDSLRAHFRTEYGRVRAVAAGPDGFLYFTTSNRDGRATPQANDDKIIRVNLEVL